MAPPTNIMDRPAACSGAFARRSSRCNDASLRTNGATQISHLQPYNQFRRDTRLKFPTSPPHTQDGEIDLKHFDIPRFSHELNCDRRRPEEELEDKSRLHNMSPTLVGQTVTPFLKEHVPSLYAPVSKVEPTQSHQLFRQNNYNSKYCYRHSPASKCRKAADEDKMAMIQTVRCH